MKSKSPAKKESTFEKVLKWIAFFADLASDARIKYNKHFNGIEPEVTEPVKTEDAES